VQDPRFDWTASIIDARAVLDDKLSPSLRRDVEARLTKLYAAARKQTSVDLLKYHERDASAALPTQCPYTVDQILAEDWYPDPQSGEAK
jgi:Domain of unknown function DUF29